MPSFDIVSEVNQVEVHNAVDQANKEVSTRFDFKGSDARIEMNDKEKTLTVFADDDFKLGQVRDVLTAKLAKRGVDIRCLKIGDGETISGNKMKQLVTVRGEDYQIVDIGMRMLTPRELFNAQGFPPDYIIDRDARGEPITKTAQVAKCGNSVCPPLAEALVRSQFPEIIAAQVAQAA